MSWSNILPRAEMSLLAFQLVAESHFANVVCHWSLLEYSQIHISCRGCPSPLTALIKDQVRAQIINKVEPMPSSTLKSHELTSWLCYYMTLINIQITIPFVYKNLATVTRHSKPPHHVWPVRLGWINSLIKYTIKKITVTIHNIHGYTPYSHRYLYSTEREYWYCANKHVTATYVKVVVWNEAVLWNVTVIFLFMHFVSLQFMYMYFMKRDDKNDEMCKNQDWTTCYLLQDNLCAYTGSEI